MKVTNLLKNMLILKSDINEYINLEGGESHTFKKEEYSRYVKSCEAFKKEKWLMIEKSKMKKDAEPIADPVEAVDMDAEVMPEKKAKRRGRPSRK